MLLVLQNKRPVNASKNDPVADCHGFTFASNSLWINDDQVNKILDHDNYTRNVLEKDADIVIFRKNGDVVHPGKRNANGTYDNNAGYDILKKGGDLVQASKNLTDVKVAKNVEFDKKNAPDKKVNINSGSVGKGIREFAPGDAAILKILQTLGPITHTSPQVPVKPKQAPIKKP